MVDMLSAGQIAQARANVAPAKPIQLYGVVENGQALLESKLDTDKSGGLDFDELGQLGIGQGKNDRAAFAAVDANGDGQLDLKELQASSLFAPRTLDALLAQQQTGAGFAGWLTAEADANGDGALTLDEFRAIAPPGQTPAPTPAGASPDEVADPAERAFAAADSDGDGEVTAAELAGIMTAHLTPIRLGSAATAQAADLLGLDADSSGGLSKAELAQVSGATSTDVDAVFATVDTDGDGQVTTGELDSEIDAHRSYYEGGPMIAGADGRNDFTPSADQAALFRVMSENLRSLTQQMIAGAAAAQSGVPPALSA
jgi:Ca2+-binding EF-hand superfamily protein